LEQYILHLEVQTDADASMPGRILQYFGWIWLRDKLPILPVVIWLFPVSVPASPWQVEGPEGPIVTLHFRSIKLWEEPVEEWLAAGELAPLIFTPLLKGATLASVGTAAEHIQALPDAAERGNAINYLVLFAIRQFGRDAVLAYFKENAMLDTFVTQSEWYQEILQRGEQRGEQSMAQRMAQRALEGRFGTAPEDILAALPQAEEATLEAIVLHITTDLLEQVRERLGLPTGA
jgi:hypothetical protein